ncbi:MAG TPA: non-canonical purine NTP pyrophosphatase, partial [Advenella sp.]|nr:non-canonical purine NTP pyrophosphatase [Advenella sp.]
MDVVLASGNKGKLREFSALFAPLGMRLIPQQEL